MRTAELQGAILSLTTRTDADLMKAVRKGLPASAITGISSLGYNLQSIVELVGPRTTIQRKIKEHLVLGSDESDRLARLARIVALAENTFGSREKAQKWLQRPSRQLMDHEAPIKLLDTDQGARLVEERLVQIAHGMFA